MNAGINFKIIVLGPQGVGKSSLIMRYIKGQFQDNYHVTVGVEFASKIITVQAGELVRIQVWDTAGQQLFQAVVRSFYKGIAAVFFVFALDSMQSLKDLQKWVDEVSENAKEEVVLFLIGTRADEEGKREIQAQEAAAFVKKIGAALYVQTSAKTAQNVNLLFEKAAEILYKKYKSNHNFAKLVEPEETSEITNPQGRFSYNRQQSFVLKRQTLKLQQTKQTKKKCCQ